ncbi:hypothetical protein A6A29_21240 [Streptomyces sp. TSRI0281]|nr:hypothetical protein A6A29_21240 [Streptomyces sp. TSRI0281]
MESLRDELDRLVAELEEAEAVRDRLVIAKETVSEVLSGPAIPRICKFSGMPGRLSRNRRWPGWCPARWCRCGGKGWT